MNRQRKPRSFGTASGVPRSRPSPAASPPKGPDHGRPAGPSAEGAIFSFLSELLIGDSTWTMAEVQRLIAMRDIVELGRRPSAELDGQGPTAP